MLVISLDCVHQDTSIFMLVFQKNAGTGILVCKRLHDGYMRQNCQSSHNRKTISQAILGMLLNTNPED